MSCRRTPPGPCDQILVQGLLRGDTTKQVAGLPLPPERNTDATSGSLERHCSDSWSVHVPGHYISVCMSQGDRRMGGVGPVSSIAAGGSLSHLPEWPVISRSNHAEPVGRECASYRGLHSHSFCWMYGRFSIHRTPLKLPNADRSCKPQPSMSAL